MVSHIEPMTTTAPVINKAEREEAIQLVISGLNNIKAGLLKYHNLGLGTKELFEDLKERGWDKSYRTLQRAAADLRTEGLLPPTNQGARTDIQKKGDTAVTSSSVLEAVKEMAVVKRVNEERLFSVQMVEALQQREIELVQENENLKTKLADLEMKVDEYRDLLKDNSIEV